MFKYTVIGYYSENNQTTADKVEAETGEEALRKCALERLGEYDKENDYYDDQDEFELVVAILQGGDGAEPKGLTFPGDGGGMMEARDYIDPKWRFVKPAKKEDDYNPSAVRLRVASMGRDQIIDYLDQEGVSTYDNQSTEDLQELLIMKVGEGKVKLEVDDG